METLTELFSRDPLNLSDSDIDKIIENFRTARMQFITTGKSPKKEQNKTAQEDILKSAGLL